MLARAERSSAPQLRRILGRCSGLDEVEGGSAQRERVDRLHQLGVGLGLPGDPLIGVAIEQHQDLGVGHAPGFSLEAQVEAGGHTAHVADLQIEHHQVGLQLDDRRSYIDPSTHSAHLGAWFGQGREDLFGQRIGVGGNENVRHGNDGNPPDMLRDTPQEEAVLEIHIENGDDYTLCRPTGELDAYTVGQFREALTNLAEEPKLLIDLSEVPFMDSAGLGALIGGIRRAREAEGDVVVACSRPTLTRLLHTTGFDRIVPVTESIDEAVQAFGQNTGDDD